MNGRGYRAECLMVFGLLLFNGCGGGVVHALTRGALYSDTDDCKSMPERQPPQLDQYLTGLEAELATGKTGVHVLEDGAGALMARQWLTTNAARSIDIQYFIFSSDALGLIAADEVLRAAERGVKVRLLVDDASARAIPKSDTATDPSSLRRMFWGLMSRCITPLSWACCKARAICTAISVARCHGRRLPF